MTFEFIGIDLDNFRTDLLYGGLLGFFFIALPFIIPGISIAVSQSFLEDYTIYFILAPIFEEFAFRGVMLSYLMNLFKDRFKLSFFAPVLAVTLQAALFSIYHLAAYGAGASAAFMGAFLFGLAAGILVLLTRNILSSMIAHAIVNSYIVLFGSSGMVIVG